MSSILANIKWDWWVIWGLVAQIAFTGRFLLQWLVSEREKKSVIPLGFWFLSVGGAALLLAYAIKRADPVFILGQTFGFVVYLRNLRLLDKQTIAQGQKKRHLVNWALGLIFFVALLATGGFYFDWHQRQRPIILEPAKMRRISASELVGAEISLGENLALATATRKNAGGNFIVVSRFPVECQYYRGKLFFSHAANANDLLTAAAPASFYEYHFNVP